MSERVKKILEGMGGSRRFVYDHNEQRFVIGARELGIREAKENTRLLGAFSEDVVSSQEPALTFAHWNPLGMPSMYDWINDNFTRQVSRETVDVMRDVYSVLRPDIPKDILSDNGHMGFSAQQPERGRGHVILTVLGICACMGVSATGLTGERYWPSKYASYDMHNMDTPEQRVAINAGLAHIALRTEQDLHAI